MRFDKKDKNGNPLVVRVVETPFGGLCCNAHRKITIRLFGFSFSFVGGYKFGYFRDIKQCHGWSCDEFDKWADRVVDGYNDHLTRI